MSMVASWPTCSRSALTAGGAWPFHETMTLAAS